MKKGLICLALAASVVSVNLHAQTSPSAGGADASSKAFGGANPALVGAGLVATAITAGLVHNSNGLSPERPPIVVIPPVEPPVDPTCNGDDELVDGVCINTTVTVTTTLTGTGTNTSTITVTVPVSSTYLPTN